MDERWAPLLESFAEFGVSPEDFVILAIVLVLLGILGAIAYAIYLVVQRRKARLQEGINYEAVCKKQKLDADERKILDGIVAVSKPQPLLKIFASKNLFDQCVAVWTKSVGSKKKEEHAEILIGLRKKLGFAKAREGVQVVSSRSLTVRQMIEIELTERTPPLELKVPVLMVDDFGITVEIPLEIEKKTFFRLGEKVDVQFTRPGEGTYGFLSRVVQVPSKRKLVIEHSEKLSVSQLRGHVRVDIHLPAKFKRIPAEFADNQDRIARIIGDDNSPPIAGEVVNLSGDGALLKVPTDFTKGESVHFRIQLDGKDKESKITFFCRVLGSSPAANGKEFFLRTKFVDMADTVREKIVQLLFKFQNENLKQQSGM